MQTCVYVCMAKPDARMPRPMCICMRGSACSCGAHVARVFGDAPDAPVQAQRAQRHSPREAARTDRAQDTPWPRRGRRRHGRIVETGVAHTRACTLGAGGECGRLRGARLASALVLRASEVVEGAPGAQDRLSAGAPTGGRRGGDGEGSGRWCKVGVEGEWCWRTTPPAGRRCTRPWT